MREGESSSAREQAAGRAQLEEIKRRNAKLRAQESKAAEMAAADTVVDRRFGVAQPAPETDISTAETQTGNLVEGQINEAEDYSGAEAAGEIDVSDLRAELAGKKETFAEKLKRSERGDTMVWSPEEVKQLKNLVQLEDEKRIEKIRRDIEQVKQLGFNNEETSDISPWSPKGGARDTVRAAAPQPELPSNKGQLISKEYLKQVEAASELKPDVFQAIGQSEIKEKGPRFGGTAAEAPPAGPPEENQEAA